ncbi:MAG: OmpA family protein [Spirochaetota bacterium]|nr:OmpA family protein [Spirochaetota bacterium]
MAIERKKKQLCPKMPVWMTTFTDMTTLLLTFFILMFTTAEIDGYEIRLILSSFTGSFGNMEGGLSLQKGPLAHAGMTVETLPSTKVGQTISKAFKEARSDFKPDITSRRIKMTEDIRGLVISIPGQTFFEPGSAIINKDGKKLLEKIVRLFVKIKAETGEDNQIEIEGHASVEMETMKKDSKVSEIWEKNLDLSTERAKNVEKFFVEKFLEDDKQPLIIKNDGHIAKFVAKGYGEFEPLEPGVNPELRAWNRRVDIVIKRD